MKYDELISLMAAPIFAVGLLACFMDKDGEKDTFPTEQELEVIRRAAVRMAKDLQTEVEESHT